MIPLLDFLFPRRCHLCGAPLSEAPDKKKGDGILLCGEKYICSPCLNHLPRSLYHRREHNPMAERFLGYFPFRSATGHFLYSHDSSLAKLIHDFKYHGFPGLARHLGYITGMELLPTGFFTDIDVIVPVPVHIFKQACRGYNQAMLFALGVSDATGLPAVDALKAVRRHRSQTGFSPEERRRNVENIFRLRKNYLGSEKGVLIVDDVCTTGATLTAAAQAIISQKPDISVSLLTLAVTV